MGLPVVLGIVKGHGGAITVTSRPDLGTTLDVYIPAAGGVPKPAGEEAGPPLAGKGHVLFVDDEDILVRTIPPLLEKLGFTVTATADPREALAFFRRDPSAFRLVITDQTMPGITGDRLAREMLRIRPGLPIILCTGFSEVVREDEIRRMGVKEFVMKPFSTAEIAEKIRAALKGS
jgi:two-component system, cell cycle sensor histidine kinase and response regulator CckA